MIVLLVFFASGFTALVYEMLWVRMLTLVLGNTVEATTAVLSAFMAGLALGSVAFGRYMDRSAASPLRVYAWLEAGIAASALAFPLALEAMVPVYRSLYQAAGSDGTSLSAVRFVASFALLLVPTTLMGGTLPALGKHLVSRAGDVGENLGLLYAVNTLGGVTGVLLSGFALIPTFGPWGANLRAVAITSVVALAAAALSRRPVAAAFAAPVAPDTTPAPSAAAPGLAVKVVLVAYFVSGFVALALEIVWTRLLILVFGSTTHAFTLMLATFLAGLALGSAAIRGRVDRLREPGRVLGATLMVCAAMVALSSRAVDALPHLYLRALTHLGLDWAGDVWARALLSVAMMLPATMLFGATFPLASRTITDLGALGRGVGRIYATNTVGAILGSLAAGFVLLPRLGMQTSIAVLVVLLAAAGLLSLLFSGSGSADGPGRRPAAAVAGIAAAAAIVLAAATAPDWDKGRLSAGVYMAPSTALDADGRVILNRALSEQRVLLFAEGTTATVAVVTEAGTLKTFKVDGKSEISTLHADRRIGRLLGHLPMLVHPDARNAINIGLGAGLTVSGLAAHPAARIDVAEIEPVVQKAARAFAAENDDVLSDPRVRLVFNDGRNHLLLTAERYDVITSDPFEPTVGGAASLFTREHFASMKARLAPGGIVCQWIPLYEMYWPEWGSILKAFASVFPHATVWVTGTDVIVLGTEHHMPLDFRRLAARAAVPSVRAQLADIGLEDPDRLAASYLFEIEGGGGTLLADVPLNSDEAPYLEFAAPQRRWTNTIGVNLARLLALRGPIPPDMTFADEAGQRRVAVLRAAQNFANLAQVSILAGRGEEAQALAGQARALDPANRLAAEVLVGWHMGRAGTLAATGDSAGALAALEQAAALDPEAAKPLLALAWAHLDAGGLGEARRWASRVLELFPDSLYARVCLAAVAAREGKHAEAEQHLAAALAVYPRSPSALLTLADLQATTGRPDDAQRTASKVTDDDPDNPAGHFFLAQLAVRRGRADDTRRHLDLALLHGGDTYRRRAAGDPFLKGYL